ncbi:MAG: hypothetical protein ACREDS_09365 [Limisphaerales bacterium]
MSVKPSDANRAKFFVAAWFGCREASRPPEKASGPGMIRSSDMVIYC